MRKVSLAGDFRERSHRQGFCLCNWTSTGKYINIAAFGNDLMNKMGTETSLRVLGTSQAGQ